MARMIENFNGTDYDSVQLFNQQDSVIGVGLGIDGGGGVGVSYGGGGGGVTPSQQPAYIPIVNEPNLPNSNQEFSIRVSSNVKDNTVLYINGQNSYKTLDTVLYFTLTDLINNGQRVLTVENPNYTTNEKYIIDVVNNPTFELQNINYGIVINPYDSLIQYQNRQLYTERSYIDSVRVPYTNTPAFTVRVTKYLGDTFVGYTNTITNPTLSTGEFERFIDFTLESNVIDNPVLIDVPVSKVTLSIFVDGPDNSVSVIKQTENGVNVEEIILKSGNNEIVDYANTLTNYLIQSANLSTFRIKEISKSGTTIRTSPLFADKDESVTTTITADGDYSVNIVSENVVTIENPIPSVFFLNKEYLDSDEFKNYNKNSQTDIAIAVGITNVDSLTVFVGQESIIYNGLSSESKIVVSIPFRYLSTIGNYIVRISPNNSFGTGDFIETAINVVDDVWVGIPDLRDITYPSLLRGPDYVGTNVDFTISYSSIDTDYVKVYVGNTAGAFTTLPKDGTHTLNFQQLLTLGNITTNEDEDLLTLQLVLVPFNTSGRQIVSGKEEIISIQFDKGDLTIPRDVVISRIAEGFISQFDESIFVDETSKYLTHLLHLGGGDNKVITTWEGDGDSLILKLYEPLETSIQPNQQVWISKIQANPIVETITISGVDTSFCAPLKGPNFSLNPDNGIGFQVFDDLIGSGSKTSTDIFNKISEQTTIDTTKLNIQYVSGSVYTFENFVHYGSALERVENFYYKIKLLEQYQTKYISLVQSSFPIGYLLTEDAGGSGTPELEGDEIINTENEFGLEFEVLQVLPAPYAQIEAQKVAEKISNLIKSFDGFENFLFKSEDLLAYPKEDFFDSSTQLNYRVIKPTNNNDVKNWYNNALNLSEYYDKYNSYCIKNNLPEYLTEDYNNSDFLLFCDMIGQHFDILWCYINGLKTTKKIEHRQESGLPNQLISYLLQSMGWDVKKAFNSQFLWEYLFGTTKEGGQKYSRSLEDANFEVWRRILNNLPYLLKHKGTGRAMKAAMACYGVPQSMLTIMEFGGPQDPTEGGSTKFTFDDRTAAIFLDSGSAIDIPWKYDSDILSYPNAVEFRIKPAKLPNPSYTIISGSEWQLDVVSSTGSFATLKLNFGGDVSATTYVDEPFISASVSTYYFDTASYSPYIYGVDLYTSSLGFPISLEEYSNVIINRHNYGGSTSMYEVWWATSNGNRITTFVSMSVLTDDSQWETGNFLHIGSSDFVGNVDEVRLWSEPLSHSKFENHTLFPDAINGNQYNSSTEHLLLRLDFEYPKDRTKDSLIKNVAVSDNYGEPYAYAVNTYSASAYPYQYTPYDRTVTATVPSLGFNVSNKIRFEEQELITDLSYKVRATKKSFDRAPIDSSRLGLFFSPIKELNMDILKSFGDFNIDNYIGDPSDEYKDSYKQLDILRGYYFERLESRNIYEYIQLVRYIDRSLFEVLADLAPARAKISKGLLIEPHYLERSKTRWDKPVSEKNDFDSTINTRKEDEILSEYLVENAELNAQEQVVFDSSYNTKETDLDAFDVITLESNSPTYDASINDVVNSELEASAPFYEATIFAPSGSTLESTIDVFKSEQIGMDRDSLSNLGFGLYGKNGVVVVRNWDGIFGNTETTGSRKYAYLVREQKTKKINTQVAGWPTNGSQPGDTVKYQYVVNTYDEFKVSILPTGSVSIGGEVVEVTPLNGYFRTHYKFTNNLSEGLQRTYWKGSQQTAATTPDGLDPIETFTTNPNILRVAKTGRGSGEPILEVD